MCPSPKPFSGILSWQRASHDYEGLRDTIRGVFVPFDEALQRLYALVEEVNIPEQ